MGQAVTKAASSLVGGRAMAIPPPSIVLARRTPPSSSIGATPPRRPRDDDAADADASSTTSSTPPAASSSSSSSLAMRGRIHMARIAADIASAASADGIGRRRPGDDRPPPTPRVGGGGGIGGVPELPPDLLKFLNDAGPLRRVVDRDLTSPRVYDALSSPGKGGDGTRDEHAKLANARVRRRMPLVQNRVGGVEENDNDDGTTTERTTNFSTVDRSTSMARAGLGVSRLDYYRALSRLAGGGMDIGGAEWKGTVDEECERILAAAASSSPSMEEEEKLGGFKRSRTFDELRDAAIFEDSLKYIGLPVLMRDSEGDIIGVWHHKANDMRHSSGLKIVREGSVQFVMLKEGDDVVNRNVP
ncbi:hypothetical protein ACHAXA_004608 [Cyclostephanos tholiformis]|uniref:Uncharacterized protein n=1 Tax=Cyclostephanos tholiformis TaxID=382380 RepID=A0ABD3SP99_9STRA